ncbi:hypothetical protein HGB07_09275, partial [Candidatus Roizmanbacteria bacterium]|nr:hypothetical protein [Candidatus Roizmanbacteria bacterium]
MSEENSGAEIPSVEKIEYTLPLSIPEGITIGDLRQKLPISEKLEIQLKLTSGSGENCAEPLVARVGDNEWRMYPGVTYEVNNNSALDGDTYLNPVNPPTDIDLPECSDMSPQLDCYLSSHRDFYGRKIEFLASTPHLSLKELCEKLQRQELDWNLRNEFNELNNKKDIESMNGIFDALIETSGLGREERGNNLYVNLHMNLEISAQNLWTDRHSNGDGDFSVEEAYREVAEPYLQELKHIIDMRVPELKQLVADPTKQIAFAFDHKNDWVFVTTYIPGKGWGIAEVTGDCPAYAVRYFESLMDGTMDDNPVFLETAAKEGDRLTLDKEQRLIRYDDADRLRINMAVCHPGSTVTDALETLQGLSHPIYGEYFSFKALLFKNTSGYSKNIDEDMLPPL